MTASYPASVPTWTTKKNYVDIVWADHMNRVQDEIQATQITLGEIPHKATANPGGLKPVHPTVAARIQSVARGEQVPFFRGSVRDYRIVQGAWHRPTFRADDDLFGMYTGQGIKLNETGYWVFTVKADWKSTPASLTGKAARMVRLEVNGSDIGVRDVIQENGYNRAALHNHVTWSDTYTKGDVITMGVRYDLAGYTGDLPVHAYMRAHFVRVLDSATGGGSVPFDPAPDQTDTGPVSTPDPIPRNPCRRYTVICRPSWEYEYVPPGCTWSPVRLDICDDGAQEFHTSEHPVFGTWDEADAYRRETWSSLTNNGRYYISESGSDYVVSGYNWPTIPFPGT